MKVNDEYSHNGDLVIVMELVDEKTVLVSNEDACFEDEVPISELEPRDNAVRGFWDC